MINSHISDKWNENPTLNFFSKNKGEYTLRARFIIIGLLLFCVLLVPTVYGISTVYTIRNLKWNIPHLTVELRNKFNLYLCLSFTVYNPTLLTTPTTNFEVYIDVNRHLLFKTSSVLKSLRPNTQTTMDFATHVNMDIWSGLFWCLMNYLKGESVELYAHFTFSITLVRNITIYDKLIEHTLELY